MYLHVFLLSSEQFVSSCFQFSMTCIYDVILLFVLLKVYLKYTSVKMEKKILKHRCPHKDHLNCTCWVFYLVCWFCPHVTMCIHTHVKG